MKDNKGKMKVWVAIVIGIAAIVVGLFMLLLLIPEDWLEDDNSGAITGLTGTDMSISGLREHYVDAEHAESVVWMVYMIGSDMETLDGSATRDLKEMIRAEHSDNVKIVVQTGGSEKWQNKSISADSRQRFLVDGSGLHMVKNVGEGSMIDSSALSDFIQWTAEKYPADRYCLSFWNHGGGTVGGFGCDEKYKEDGSLSLADIADAIGNSGVKFDIVGYDACMMATIESAYALEPYADYLIASETSVPGYGWSYTGFLSMLGNNPSVPSIELSKKLIDDYAGFYQNENITLSLIELREIPYVYEKTCGFMNDAKDEIQVDNTKFQNLSMARSDARTFDNNFGDQVDILDMVERTDFKGKEDVAEAVRSCVKYRNDSSIQGAGGLAVYFPYEFMEYYSNTCGVLDKIGYDSSRDAYDYFMSIMANAKGYDASAFLNRESEDYSSESWYDSQTSFHYSEDMEALSLEETENGFELKLTEEERNQITDERLAVIKQYEDGYLNLGYDNIVDWTEDGSLLVEFDHRWISLEGIAMMYFADRSYSDDEITIFSGRTPALLNDNTKIELVIQFDPLDDEIEAQKEYSLTGHVMGYRLLEEDIQTQGKGLHTLEKGDTIKMMYEYFDSDGNFAYNAYSNEKIVVKSQDELTISDEKLTDGDVVCWVILTDIYQQDRNTESVKL